MRIVVLHSMDVIVPIKELLVNPQPILGHLSPQGEHVIVFELADRAWVAQPASHWTGLNVGCIGATKKTRISNKTW